MPLVTAPHPAQVEDYDSDSSVEVPGTARSATNIQAGSMSESDSSSTSGSDSHYPNAPRVQHANASSNYVAASYAALRNLPIRPIIEDDNWHSNSPSDFHQRFRTGRHYLTGETRTVAPGSNAALKAVTVNPSQYSGGSVLSRYQAPGCLEEGDDGVLQRPAITQSVEVRYEGFMLEKAAPLPGEKPSWSRAGRRPLPFPDSKLAEISNKVRLETRSGPQSAFHKLPADQQDIVNRLIVQRQHEEQDAYAVWALDCLKQYKEKNSQTNTVKTVKIMVILRRQDRKTYSFRATGKAQYERCEIIDLDVPIEDRKHGNDSEKGVDDLADLALSGDYTTDLFANVRQDSTDVISEVREYAVQRAANARACENAQSRKASTGRRYRCTVGCTFSTDSPDAWKRHIRNKYPQTFWHCILCRGLDKKPFICHRRGKMDPHLEKIHDVPRSQYDTIKDQSEVKQQGLVPDRCPFENEQGSCGCIFHTWEEFVQHCLEHFQDGTWHLRPAHPSAQRKPEDEVEDDNAGADLFDVPISASLGPYHQQSPPEGAIPLDQRPLPPSPHGQQNHVLLPGDGDSFTSLHPSLEMLLSTKPLQASRSLKRPQDEAYDAESSSAGVYLASREEDDPHGSPTGELLDNFEGLASALNTLHQHDNRDHVRAHFDLKPENILISSLNVDLSGNGPAQSYNSGLSTPGGNGTFDFSKPADSSHPTYGIQRMQVVENAGFDEQQSAKGSSDVDGSDNDSVLAESIFSEASIASTATTASVHFLGEDLIEDFVSILFCTEDLCHINASAIKEPTIGAQRYQRNVRRLIASYGRNLKRETAAADQDSAARILQSRTMSSRAARDIVYQAEAEHGLDQGVKMDVRDLQRKFWKHNSGDESDIDSDISVEDEENVDATRPDIQSIQEFLLNSKAYDLFKQQLVGFVQKPYQERLLEALGTKAVSDCGRALYSEEIKGIGRDISWTPVRLINISTTTSDGQAISDRMKARVEDVLGERLNWWPLQQPKRPLPPKHARLSWVSPHGAARHVDLPQKAAEAVEAVLPTAPAFVNTANPGPSPCGSSSHQANGAAHSQASNTTQNPGKQPLGAQPQGAGLSSTASSLQQGAQVNQPPLLPSPRHIFLCVRKGSRHKFQVMDVHPGKNDAAFFLELKKKYNLTRGRLRRWFSMWRYDRCDFYQFHKYAINEGAPRREDFPPKDSDYEFLPRPMDPSPPGGPILDYEFRDRFYLSCEHCHSWHFWHRERMRNFQINTQDAIALLPKRPKALDMADGVREVFWGIYAREKRCVAWIVGYGCLFNLPWVMFFCLWLWKWGHSGDLQNAAVPVGISLSLTVLYGAWIFETREAGR